MKNINFEKYLGEKNSNENHFFNPELMIKIIEETFNSDINSLKNKAMQATVFLTSQQIKKYLNELFEQENPKVKERISKKNEATTDDNTYNFDERNIKDIEEATEDFMDSLTAKDYEFYPYTLEYFKKYISIIKSKTFFLLNIIENIIKKETIATPIILEELDIVLDENGDISREDIIRLVEPTIYNITVLNEKVMEANNLKTYVNFRISKDLLYRRGISQDELYPTTSIQVKSLEYSDLKGNVKLSKKQEEQLWEAKERNIRKVAKLMLN